MANFVLRQPVILYETIEAMYQWVNGISVERRKAELFRKYGLLLRSHFVFYDYSEPVIFFLIDYLSVMALFVLIGYYFIQGLKRSARLGQGLCRMDESDFLKRG